MTELANYTYNSAFLWYEQTFTFNGAPLKIVIIRENEKDLAVLEKRLKQIVGSFLQAPETLADLCTQALLAKKNEAWLREGEPECTRDALKEKLQLSRITINADGSGTFMYNAGDLFWGHAVVAEVNPDYSFSYANIEG